ncbi:MAG TPA: hypothetical protein VFN23_12560, partial [Ktedonobacteraceae bacterium]|nr:hypothetical protein [Ktedonobacteraceae bacterium]
MTRFSWHNKWILPGVLLFCFAALILLLFILNQYPSLLTSQAQAPTQKPGNQPSNISMNRTIKAYASSGYTPASAAIDGNYDTSWRSVGSQSWLAYDLSGLPISQRQQVLVVWYNETLNYDHTLIKYQAYNLPENYTLEVNTAPGGGNPPTSRWKTLVSVVENHYHSRQHIINMAGANWVRINITKVDGSIENFDTSINMGIYVASSATADDWIFYGDSITAGGMSHATLGGIKSFSQLINQN